ncbi:MAG: endolytic transglycosylase MltG [Campylobacterota bacterium]|nr:endolytic transglycosylase MltG [Campylobacterota bacterium]
MKQKKSAPYRLFTILAGAIVFILFLLIMYNETPLTKGKAVFYIPSSAVNDVAESLEKSGYELSGVDRFILDWVELPQAGWYRMDPDELGRLFFFKNLHQKQAETMRIVIFAGDTTDEILHRLARDMVLSEERLKANYKKYSHFREGGLLADKYIMARAADEEAVIQYLLDRSYSRLDLFAGQEFGSDYNVSQLREALITASIIQKESNDAKEMPYISSVIYNRLKKGMKLQMDGTLNYGKYSRTIVTPERIRNDKSRFNTYKHKGLPPYPLCAVSMDALEAAVLPRESDYLFFMLNEKGKHNFAATYDKHLQNIKTFKNHRKQMEEKKKAEEAKRIAILKQKQEESKKAKEAKAAKLVKVKTEQKGKKSRENNTSSIKLSTQESNTTKKPIETEEHNRTLENNISTERKINPDNNISVDDNESNRTGPISK